MSRLLKILLYAVVLFFLFLWLSSIVKSCGSETSTPTTSTAVAEDTQEETYEEDDFFEDEESEDVNEENVYANESDESYEEQIDYTEIDKVVEEKLNDRESDPEYRSNQSTGNNRNTNVSKGNSGGKYMVIAGSFLIEKNAENMRRRLNNLGYDNADLVVFDLSQYHSVVAARFSTYEAALKVSNELKRKGLDCYVHAQQF